MRRSLSVTLALLCSSECQASGMQLSDKKTHRLVPFCLIQLTLPDGYHIPALHGKSLKIRKVASTIARNLLFPECRVALWNHIIAATFMTVPETAVHKDHGTVLRKHNVRVPRIALVILAESETLREQIASHKHLWLGILSSNAAHCEMSLLCCNAVHFLFYQLENLFLLSDGEFT